MHDVKTCRSCGREIIWFKTRAGKPLPVDANSVEIGDDTNQFEFGRHVSHFATCPDAGKWRKPKED